MIGGLRLLLTFVLFLCSRIVSTSALSLSVKVISTAASIISCELGTIEVNIVKDVPIRQTEIETVKGDAVNFALRQNRLLSAENLSAKVIMKEGTTGVPTAGAIDFIEVSASTPVPCRAVMTLDQRVAKLEADYKDIKADNKDIRAAHNRLKGDNKNIRAEINRINSMDAAENTVFAIQDVSSVLKLFKLPRFTIGASVALFGGKESRDAGPHFMGKTENPAERAYRETVGLQVLKELQKQPDYADVVMFIQDKFAGATETPSAPEAIEACIKALPDSIQKCAVEATEEHRDEFAKKKKLTVVELDSFFRRLLHAMHLKSVEELPPL
jgi:hypothetical protein